MNAKKLSSVCAIAFIVIGSGGGVVAAESQSASTVEAPDEGPQPQHPVLQSLGIPPNSVDVWSLQCGLGTVVASVNVIDYAWWDGVTLRVTLTDGHGRAATQVTPSYGGVSPPATLNTGSGNYLVIITKSAAGVKSYASYQECRNASGAPAPHSALLVQDQ